ncbi:MAG: glycosyltransferase, partial [Acidobacteriota bacterium]
MKILYLNHNVAWSGGTFLRAFPYARGLAALGHDVTLLTISRHERFTSSSADHQGVRVIETPDLFWGRGRSGWDPWDVLNRMFLVGGERHWDIIHSWDCRPVAILPALWAKRRAAAHGAKLLTDWADWWGRGGTQTERQGSWMRLIWPIETYFEEGFRGRADGTTAISTALRDRSIQLGAPASRVRVLPQGCNPPVVRSRSEARARIGVAAETRLLLYVGRLNKSDGDLLFPVVQAVLAKRRDARFVMLGNHGSRIPTDLAQHPAFATLGVVPTSVLDDYVAACDLSIVPLADTLASQARWPSKINGFLSAGRAVVTTRVGDLAALLARDSAAFVTEPNVDAIVAGVHHVLDDAAHRQAIEEA